MWSVNSVEKPCEKYLAEMFAQREGSDLPVFPQICISAHIQIIAYHDRFIRAGSHSRVLIRNIQKIDRHEILHSLQACSQCYIVAGLVYVPSRRRQANPIWSGLVDIQEGSQSVGCILRFDILNGSLPHRNVRTP